MSCSIFYTEHLFASSIQSNSAAQMGLQHLICCITQQLVHFLHSLKEAMHLHLHLFFSPNVSTSESEPNHNFLQTLYLVHFYHYTSWNGLSLQLLWAQLFPKAAFAMDNLTLQTWANSEFKHLYFAEPLKSSPAFFYMSMNQQWPQSPLPLVSSQIGWVRFTTVLHIFIHSPWIERVSRSDVCKCKIRGWCWKVEEQKCRPTADRRKMSLMAGSSEVRCVYTTRQLSLNTRGTRSLTSGSTCSGLLSPLLPHRGGSPFQPPLARLPLPSVWITVFVPLAQTGDSSIKIIDQNNQSNRRNKTKEEGKKEAAQACYQSLLISLRDAPTTSSTSHYRRWTARELVGGAPQSSPCKILIGWNGKISNKSFFQDNFAVAISMSLPGLISLVVWLFIYLFLLISFLFFSFFLANKLRGCESKGNFLLLLSCLEI